MTVYLHYIEGHDQSERLADQCEASFFDHKWDVTRVQGYTPLTVLQSPYSSHHILEQGKLSNIRILRSPTVFLRKLSILCNHIRFWETVVRADEVCIYAEHDVLCKLDYFDLPKFDDILTLNFDQEVYDNGLYKQVSPAEDERILQTFDLQEGVNDIPSNWEYMYSLFIDGKPVNRYHDARMIPSASCYALTPKGAAKLLDAVNEYGLEQGDQMMNDYNVDIKIYCPSLIKYNQESSLHSLDNEYY
jgi:hypothetical protein